MTDVTRKDLEEAHRTLFGHPNRAPSGPTSKAREADPDKRAREGDTVDADAVADAARRLFR